MRSSPPVVGSRWHVPWAFDDTVLVVFMVTGTTVHLAGEGSSLHVTTPLDRFYDRYQRAVDDTRTWKTKGGAA